MTTTKPTMNESILYAVRIGVARAMPALEAIRDSISEDLTTLQELATGVPTESGPTPDEIAQVFHDTVISTLLAWDEITDWAGMADHVWEVLADRRYQRAAVDQVAGVA